MARTPARRRERPSCGRSAARVITTSARMAPTLPSPQCSRRTWLHGLAAAAGAALLPRLTRAAEVAAEPAKKRILIVGDSMIAGGVGLFLENGLHKVHGYVVRRKGKSSTGLARPDFFAWPKEAQKQVDEFAPDAAVVMFGGNDVQGLRMPDKGWITWPEPEWPEEYARRVNAFADIVAAGGKPLFWIGMPVMRPEKFHVRVQRVNTIYRAEMAIRPNAHFIDIWRLLADDKGGYADRLDADGEPGGKTVRVRAGDGIHLSVAGAQRVEAHVRAFIHTVLSGGQPDTSTDLAVAGAPADAPTPAG
nr:DUF459 domain-containing protein [Nannocystis sp. ILAH1]